jgi:drug/metabolite transporter (DMT)-like permease
MALSKSISAHISLLLCNIVWACDYPFYALVLGHYISPLAMVSASLGVAAIWSFIPLLWEKHEKIEAEDRIKIFGAALLIGISRKLCMMFGLSQTSPIDGSIISTTTPLLVLLLSVFIGLERFTKTKLIGLMLGMAGAIAIIISSSTTHYHSGLTGNLLIFASSCISALYMVYFKGLVSKYRITTLLRWIYCISALIMLPIGAHEIIETKFDTMNSKIIFASLFVLIVPTYLPNLFLNYSLRFVAPTVTSIYAYIQPIVAITLAIIMGLDSLHLDTLLFALVIFVGVGLVVGAYNKRGDQTTTS